MKSILKILLVVFAITGLLAIVLIVVFLFFMPNNSSEKPCTEKVPYDTTVIKSVNSLEDFKDFKLSFVNNYKFQLNRARFPVASDNNMWGTVPAKPWTICNWKSVTPYYVDTLTYKIGDVEEIKNTPYEKHERIFYVQDSSTAIVLTYKNLSGKWYLTERTDRK